MTFSDSRIVKELQKNWTPVWERVSPVKEVTFELGEGREVKGTVGGEIAIYFCDQKGQVFDILPALQSPAATLKAMQRALKFYNSYHGAIIGEEVRRHHHARLRAKLEELYKTHPERFPEPDGDNPEAIFQLENAEDISAKDLFPGTAENEAYRQKAINMALDDATRDLRYMALSKVLVSTPSEGKITVVEPGGRGYYSWQVSQAFCGIVPNWKDMMKRVKYPQKEWPVTSRGIAPGPTHPLEAWTEDLKQPKDWQRLLFEGILYQPLGGGKFKYDSESLEALSIIED